MPELLNPLLPVVQLADVVVLGEQYAQTALVEQVKFQRRRWTLQLLLNQFGQQKEIHDLRDTRTRKALSCGYAGFCQLRIGRKLSLPAQCQLKRVDFGVCCCAPFIHLGIAANVARKWNRAEHKGHRSPPRKRDAERECEVPAGSDFTRSSGLSTRTFDRFNEPAEQHNLLRASR